MIGHDNLLTAGDNKYQEAQIAEFDNIIAVVFAVSTTGYMDRKPVIRILFGSI
jgi:hypothetical protein